MTEDLERDLLLARRLKLGVRLVICPLLVGGVLIAWHVRHAQARSDAPVRAQGVVRSFTGSHAFAQTEDNQLRWLQTEAVEQCDNGNTFTYRLRFPPGTIRQRSNLAIAVVQPLHGVDDGGASVDYGRTIATVRVGIGQLDVHLAGSLVWMPTTGGATRCTASFVTQTLTSSRA